MTRLAVQPRPTIRSPPLLSVQHPENAPAGPAICENEPFSQTIGTMVELFQASPTIVSPVEHNVIDAWSVNLVKDGNYIFNLTPDGGATNQYTALLFRNPSPGSAYWAARPDAVLTTTGTAGYTAPAIKWEQTTIMGVTTTPIVLTGYFSQTYAPNHHNFGGQYIFDPRLEPGLSQATRDELETADIHGTWRRLEICEERIGLRNVDRDRYHGGRVARRRVVVLGRPGRAGGLRGGRL